MIQSPTSTDTLAAGIFLIIASYYTVKAMATPDLYLLYAKIITFLSLDKTTSFRTAMRRFGLSDLDIMTFFFNVASQIAARSKSRLDSIQKVPALCIDIRRRLDDHPHCPITMDDILDDSDHIKPDISAVIGLDEERNVFMVNFFNHSALEQWVQDHDKHPITRVPMSQYSVIQIS